MNAQNYVIFFSLFSLLAAITALVVAIVVNKKVKEDYHYIETLSKRRVTEIERQLATKGDDEI